MKKQANMQLEELNAKISNQNAEFEKLNRELEQVSMEKDKLFSIISHELRNPLYWMKNLTEALSQKYKAMPPEKVHKTILSLDESAKNVYHLMDNLLQWSRSKLNRVHPRKGVHNLSTLISETSFMYESFLRQKEIIFQKIIPDDIYIHADPDLFCCVIRNLISNAIKYTPNGGRIEISQKQYDEFVTVIISDSGKGINASDLKTIFAAGNTLLSMPGLMEEKGSGLGLKLCKDFAEINDGKIWVESTEESGTRFFVNVPLSNQNLQAYKKEEIALSIED
ncbi:MAG: sensor histidine kinase [Bacteroidota bacterium]